MARKKKSARPAPLPADAAARLARTVTVRLSATLDDAELVSQVGALCVTWLLADKARVRFDRARRLRLAPEVGKVIGRLARSLAWMSVAGQPYGQQDAKAGSKILRAVRTRRVDFHTLLQLEAAYRSHRQAYRRRHGSVKVYAPEECVLLDDGAMVATRVVSERRLSQLGHKALNCLAIPGHRKGYATELKEGRTSFWRIDPAERPDSPVWVVALALETGHVRELEHVGGSATMPRDRDALLEFLAGQARVSRDWEPVLRHFNLSPDLVAAAKAGAVRCVGAVLAEAIWRFELGTPGVLVAMPIQTPCRIGDHLVHAWMLHGAQTGAGQTLAIRHEQQDGEPGKSADEDGDDEDDPEMPRPLPAGPRTMLELALRFALRQACRDSLTLRRSCGAAFAAESALFLEDWFGIVPPVALTAAKQGGRG